MEGTHHVEIVILLLVAVLVLMALARRLVVPYPIFLVLGGLALSFALNGVIFILIGLQLGAIREAGLPASLGTLVAQGALISGTAIVARLVWVPIGTAIPRLLSPALRRRDPFPPWSHVLVVGWTGMRGIVSLAAALALPLTTASGATFPFRNEVILLTFAVILATLVVQGLTLTPLIRALDPGRDNSLELEEAQAREMAARAALARLDELASTEWVRRDDVDRLRAAYGQRVQRSSSIEPGAGEDSARAQAARRRLRHETLTAERRAVIALRDRGAVSDEILHRIEQELDVEAIRIGLGEVRLDGA
jgi:CPA1 family monovalent cation:H+ antiporter